MCSICQENPSAVLSNLHIFFYMVLSKKACRHNVPASFFDPVHFVWKRSMRFSTLLSITRSIFSSTISLGNCIPISSQ